MQIDGAGHHPAVWRHPSSRLEQLFNLRYYVALARQAETARLDSLSFSNRSLSRPVFASGAVSALEPFTLLAALAAQTQRIGLIASASTAIHQPYHLSRKVAALDHISRGRAAWNIQTARSEEESHLLSLPVVVERAERFERAEEFVQTVRGLWDSWDDDAPAYDKEAGILSDATKIRAIYHRGKYFEVEGPLNAPRPPQGQPVRALEANSIEERHFAARHAEVIFTASHALEDAQWIYAEMNSRLRAEGREPEDVRILPRLSFILGATQEEAQRKATELQVLGGARFNLDSTSGASSLQLADYNAGKLAQSLRGAFVGTPLQMADLIEQWFTSWAADGFSLAPALLPDGLDEFVAHVVPELQRRGLFRREYEGSRLREHLGLRRSENSSSGLAPVDEPREARRGSRRDAIAA